jgi:hypothetical protein
MRFSRRQHLKVASLLYSRSEMNSDPVKAKKQLAMTNVFRVLAQKAGAEEGPMIDDPGRVDTLQT